MVIDMYIAKIEGRNVVYTGRCRDGALNILRSPCRVPFIIG